MAMLLLISAQALLFILIASLLFQFPRPLNTSIYIACLVLSLIGFGMALILDNQTVALFDALEFFAIITAVIIILVGFGIAVRQTPKNRPIWLGITGIILFALTIGLTLIEARNDLRENLDDDTPAPVIQATPTTREIARRILDEVAAAIAGQTGLPATEVTILLDGGASVSSLISEHGGDLEVAITEITDIMTQGVQDMARNGQMDENAASFALASMPTIVRFGVNSSLNGMLARFETPESTPAP